MSLVLRLTPSPTPAHHPHNTSHNIPDASTPYSSDALTSDTPLETSSPTGSGLQWAQWPYTPQAATSHTTSQPSYPMAGSYKLRALAATANPLLGHGGGGGFLDSGEFFVGHAGVLGGAGVGDGDELVGVHGCHVVQAGAE